MTISYLYACTVPAQYVLENKIRVAIHVNKRLKAKVGKSQKNSLGS
ncbi:MAG: hypothetical protein KKE44_25480 [Proteobacteria bacterium]|nr:hypothetical protein [Pseudomonadota bacterium]